MRLRGWLVDDAASRPSAWATARQLRGLRLGGLAAASASPSAVASPGRVSASAASRRLGRHRRRPLALDSSSMPLIVVHGLVGHFVSSRDERLAAVGADADGAAVTGDAVLDARGLAAVRADDHDVAGQDRLRHVEDAALLDARLALGAALPWARLGVPLGDVQALDDDGDAGQRADLAPVRAVLADDLLEPCGCARRARPCPACRLPCRSARAPRRPCGCPARACERGCYVSARHHSTSGASETIFM